EYFLAGSRSPDLDRVVTGWLDLMLVTTATDNSPAVRAESHAPHGATQRIDRADLLACGHVPEPNRLVSTTAGYPPAIRTESHRPSHAAVSLERSNVFSACNLPDSNRAIGACAGDEPAVRADAHAIDCIEVSAKGSLILVKERA